MTPGAQANSAEAGRRSCLTGRTGKGRAITGDCRWWWKMTRGSMFSSNEITLTLVEPFDALSNDELRWEP
ncbi:hypothetical protein ACLB1R_11840 [Escherichia coli]